MEYCTLSLYLPRRSYLHLLDVAVQMLGFKSRSECLTRLLERLFAAGRCIPLTAS
jgi:hypothetical protein